MDSLRNWIINAMIEKLEEMEGQEVYGCDLGYTIFEEANVNGSYTCNAYRAMEWIKEYFSDLGEIVEYIKDNLGENSVPNVFDKPEPFQVVIMLDCSQYLISCCEFVQDNWNDNMELTAENIKVICGQLEALKADSYSSFYDVA